MGIVRLSPRDDEVLMGGLHGCEGIESALSAMVMGFVPMWAFGSTTTMEDFPVLAGVECLTIVGDNDRKTPDEIAAGDKAAVRKVMPAMARDAGQRRSMFSRSRGAGRGRQRHPQAEGARVTESDDPRRFYQERVRYRTVWTIIRLDREQQRAWRSFCSRRRRPSADRDP